MEGGARFPWVSQEGTGCLQVISKGRGLVATRSSPWLARPLCFSGKLGCDREEDSLGSESEVDEIAQHGVAWGLPTLVTPRSEASLAPMPLAASACIVGYRGDLRLGS